MHSPSAANERKTESHGQSASKLSLNSSWKQPTAEPLRAVITASWTIIITLIIQTGPRLLNSIRNLHIMMQEVDICSLLITLNVRQRVFEGASKGNKTVIRRDGCACRDSYLTLDELHEKRASLL